METEKTIGTENMEPYTAVGQIDGLSWYVAPEAFSSLLNGLAAHYNRELLNLREERQTEDYRLHCRKMLHELKLVDGDLSITDSLEKMERYIERYSPIMKGIMART
jgi:hypothetical protein